jgi:homoserine/homoserine lactone efflux protein
MSETAHLLLLYALTELLACLSPGPAVFTVASQALAGARSGAAGAIVGINVGNLVWFTLAGAGLTALEATLPQLFTVLRWGGIAYLLWLGIHSWRKADAAPHFHAARERAGFRRGLLSAAAVQLSNPKALLFFTVLLPPFINTHYPVTPQIAALATIGIALEATVLTGYAVLAFRLGRYAADKGATRAINRASGGMLVTAAVGLAGASVVRQ